MKEHKPTNFPLNDAVLRAGGIGLFIFIGCLILNNHFNWVDDAYYIVVAKALATGQGFRDINLPEPMQHRQFPPGLPALLSLPSLLIGSFDAQVVTFKLLLIACGALGLYLFTRLARDEGYSSTTITLAVMLSATSIAFVSYTYRVASEMLYVLLSILTLLAAHRYERGPKLSAWLGLTSLLMAATILTRSVGVVLFGATFLSLFLRKEFARAALITATTLLLLSPWFLLMGGRDPIIYRYIHDMFLQYKTGGANANPLGALMARIAGNGWQMIDRELPRIIFSFSASALVTDRSWLNLLFAPLRIIISLLAVTPFFFKIWPRPRIIPVYIIAYLTLLFIWPWEPSRFLIIINPFLCLAFVDCLTIFTRRVAERLRLTDIVVERLVAAAILVFFTTNLVADARFILTVWRSGDYTPQAASVWNDTLTAYGWLKEHIAPDSIIGCAPTVEAHTYLFTQLKAVPMPAQPTACHKLKITHIICINDGPINGNGIGQAESDLKLLIKRAGSAAFLLPVYENANVKIFQVDRERLASLIDEKR